MTLTREGGAWIACPDTALWNPSPDAPAGGITMRSMQFWPAEAGHFTQEKSTKQDAPRSWGTDIHCGTSNISEAIFLEMLATVTKEKESPHRVCVLGRGGVI